MNLNIFTRRQLKEIQEDLELFTDNPEYCFQANSILLREIGKEIVLRRNTIEFKASGLLYFGFFIGVGIFISLIMLNFIVSVILYKITI